MNSKIKQIKKEKRKAQKLFEQSLQKIPLTDTPSKSKTIASLVLPRLNRDRLVPDLPFLNQNKMKS